MTSLTRWDPLRDVISLREAMNRLFEESLVRSPADWPASAGVEALAVDVYQTEDAVVVKTAVPGVKPEDIDIRLTGDVLTIKGETKAEEETKDGRYFCRELRYGSFARSINVPVPVVADKAEANFENGVLTLTLPKAEEVKPKAIKVKAKEK